MENASDAVASVGPDYRVSMWFSCISNDITDFTIHLIGLTVGDRGHQTLIGLDDERSARFCYISNKIGLVEITVHTIEVCSHV